MKKILFISICISGLVFFSCHDDLIQNPTDPDLFTEVDVYKTTEDALGALAKVYGSLALTGQQGPAGNADIDPSIIDEGTSQFTRLLYTLNELTTDNAVVAWGDPGLPNIHEMSWGVNNVYIKGMYFRLSQVVSFANSFIENANAMGSSDSRVAEYIAEARFIRAFAYSQLMDLFANVPLVTQISFGLPEQSNRQEIFSFVEQELLELESLLPASGSNEYGRVDQVAASALLTRIYLNAEVYIGQNRYADVISKADAVMGSTYAINTNDANNNGTAYDELFLADNHMNGAQNEFIFTLVYDGLNSQTWAGNTFLVHAAVGGSMNPADFGINGGWFGTRTTKALVEKFSDAVTASNADGHPTAWSDARAMFYTDGQNYEIESISAFGDGYAVTKFKNLDSSGNAGSDASGNFVDTDLPVIRLAEVHLNYVEAVARGGGGSTATAVSLINALRERANAAPISASDLTIDFVMDERQRELYWEGLRRVDLIRNNQYIGANYVWPFKAGAANGKASEAHRKIFPIPEDILLVNENLTQNPDY